MKKRSEKPAEDDRTDWSPAPVPETSRLAALAKAAGSCTACPLYKRATQTVFGEGSKNAWLMFLGEQPGDQEDLAGKPFVGPAGRLLDRALEEAGIKRDEVYVTNAVKHFKWEPRGKRRIHQKPNSREIAACRPWFQAELRLVRPRLLVCLGATAAQSLFGPSFRVTRDRGKVLESEIAPKVVATVHPSSLLRQPDEESREREYAHFVADLRTARRASEKE
jgi:uracil-DNA glycosylase family protein